ncbi:hypothetical protein GUITHDRAFT_154590 [Guillardia theta CCMP2712]|uniref:Peptidoglycan binding-like domain-containing protein n=1 Tax=Guillardia theta (strain CCMP2712) TaxID=905079 RepID=L1IRP7_GUITC|nr:hypothetical protein GUITHDRAFT_154590 [Guillardia theta CCMP2712]EKX38908.1 hypothetical protein GUITHDRAFT_154590 [Guillardia theta CCMP2712]|eukprot:XP_005825888.1 hypothetical protein GUITHDRAFT_154590 [Guillardia theta CCMP2712]
MMNSILACSLPPPPQEVLSFGSRSPAVRALRLILVSLGYMECGRRDYCIGDYYGHRVVLAVKRFQADHGIRHESGTYDETTRAALVHALKSHACNGSSVASRYDRAAPADRFCSAQNEGQGESQAGSAGSSPHIDRQQVHIVDTDGDHILFELTRDGAHVTEYVNGKLEMEDVAWVVVNEASGHIRDPKGVLQVRPEEKEDKLSKLRQLFQQAGKCYSTTSAPKACTIEIDLDLDQEMNNQGKLEAIRQSLQLLHANPDAAMSSICNFFQVCSAQSSHSQEPKPEPAGDQNYKQAELNRLDDVRQDQQEEPGVVMGEVLQNENESVCRGNVAQGSQEMQDELLTLLDMGFGSSESVEELAQLLKHHGGDVSLVVSELIQRRLDAV